RCIHVREYASPMARSITADFRVTNASLLPEEPPHATGLNAALTAGLSKGAIRNVSQGVASMPTVPLRTARSASATLRVTRAATIPAQQASSRVAGATVFPSPVAVPQ